MPGLERTHESGQISIIPKPELRGFWGSSLIKPQFTVTSADVVIICPDEYLTIKRAVGLLGSILQADFLASSFRNPQFGDLGVEPKIG